MTNEDFKLIVDWLAEGNTKEDLAEMLIEASSGPQVTEWLLETHPEMEEFVSMLNHLDCEAPGEEYVTGEFLREQGEPEDGYPAMLDLAKRGGLINPEETNLTKKGREFVRTHS